MIFGNETYLPQHGHSLYYPSTSSMDTSHQPTTAQDQLPVDSTGHSYSPWTAHNGLQYSAPRTSYADQPPLMIASPLTPPLEYQATSAQTYPGNYTHTQSSSGGSYVGSLATQYYSIGAEEDHRSGEHHFLSHANQWLPVGSPMTPSSSSRSHPAHASYIDYNGSYAAGSAFDASLDRLGQTVTFSKNEEEDDDDDSSAQSSDVPEEAQMVCPIELINEIPGQSYVHPPPSPRPPPPSTQTTTSKSVKTVTKARLRKLYPCNVQGCRAKHNPSEPPAFKRAADRERHVKSVHKAPGDSPYPCPWPNCARRGPNGFSRKDHLIEHRRNYHHDSIAKRTNSGSRRA